MRTRGGGVYNSIFFNTYTTVLGRGLKFAEAQPGSEVRNQRKIENKKHSQKVWGTISTREK